jgi:hypothetical protein
MSYSYNDRSKSHPNDLSPCLLFINITHCCRKIFDGYEIFPPFDVSNVLQMKYQHVLISGERVTDRKRDFTHVKFKLKKNKK